MIRRVNEDPAVAHAWQHLAIGRELAPANVDGLTLLADQLFLTNRDYACMGWMSSIGQESAR